jgi:hypothetical protein
MRRWVVLVTVLGMAFVAVLSGTEFFGEHVGHYDAVAYQPGGDPEARLQQQFDVTPGTFSGTFAPSCGTNAVSVSAGTTTIDVAVTATLPTNDITLALLDPSGQQVAFSDTLTSPEAVHYTSSSLPAGTWTIKVCAAANATANLQPYTYTGVVTASSAPSVPLPGLPVGGVNAVDAGTVTASYVPGNLRFSPETIVDPQRTEGEPVNFFAPDGSYWESGPFGTSTQQSWVHRSTDGGLEFHETSPVGLRPDAPPGGGDTDVVVDDQGYAYFTDLEGLVNVSTSVSNDGGNTWRKNALAAQEAGVDREWYALDNGLTSKADDNTLFFTYRQVPEGPQILSSPGSTGPNDPVGGLVWTNAASASGQLSVSSGAPCGKLVFDPVKRNLYMPCGQGDHIEVVVGHVAPGQRTGIDFHTVELKPAPAKGDPTMVFPWLGTDKAGNLMVVWVDGTDHNVYESVSTDGAKSFTTPLKVNTGDAVTNEFPEVAGGDPGTFAITWYGTSVGGSSDDMPANDAADSGKFPWYGYVAVVSHADTLQPTVAQQRFTEHPMHYGMICNAGTTCTSGRTLADYFDVGVDQKGAIRVVFDDESSQYRQAHLMEVRQLAGPAPSNPMDDPSGDAQMPHYSPTGPGANLPQADFTKLALSEPSKGVLRVQMTLADLASLAPPPGKPQLVWLTRFQAKSVLPNGAEAYRIFYVGARSTGGGKPVFFSGSGDNPTGCLNLSSSGCKIVIYPAEHTLTSGTVSGNTITIDVSLQNGFGSGRPIDGSTLYSVTALSYGQNGDADVYLEGDATHSFDYALAGGVPPAVAQPTAKPSGGGGGGAAGGGPAGGGQQPVDKGVQDVAVPTKHSAIGRGAFRKASFRMNLSAVRFFFTWTQRGLRFHALQLTSVRFGAHAAAFEGVALVNGKRVRFAAVAVDHGARGDVLKVAWAGGPSRGGRLKSGGLTVT